MLGENGQVDEAEAYYEESSKSNLCRDTYTCLLCFLNFLYRYYYQCWSSKVILHFSWKCAINSVETNADSPVLTRADLFLFVLVSEMQARVKD